LVYASSNEGAAVGKYTVKVTTGRVAVLSEGVEIQPAIPETLPAKYHSSSELVAEVVPGDNEFNFDLQSK
jgi:hypothetical protein